MRPRKRSRLTSVLMLGLSSIFIPAKKDFVVRRPQVQMLSIGMPRGEILFMYPEAELGDSSDFFDMRIRLHGETDYLGFDSLNRLDYLYMMRRPLWGDSDYWRDLDTMKDYTFTGNIRNWRAYWWKNKQGQIFEAISRDSNIENIQAFSSLENPKRRNQAFQPPNDTTLLYMPYWAN